MRYYGVTIIGAPADVFPPRYDGEAIWGSHVGGIPDPGAQQVEFHIEEYNPSTPTQDSVLTVHGVSWDQIRRTNELIGKPIIVRGGMMPGLPLATLQSAKKGLLLQGQVFRAWGNWIGTDMSIGMSFQAAGAAQSGGGAPSGGGGGGESDATGGGAIESPAMAPVGVRKKLVSRKVGGRSIDRRGFAYGATTPFEGGPPTITPTDIGDIGQFSGANVFGAATNTFGDITSSLFGGGSQGLRAPLNLIHNMMPNMNLSSAISETLGRAFSSGGSNIGISDALKLGYQDAGMYQNMQQYAGYIKNLSQSILGIKNYLGVNMSSKDNTMRVWDGTKVLGWGHIDFYDLIGQPTWLEIQKIQVKCMLRGDIQGGDHVTLPPTIFALTPDAIVGGMPAGVGSPQRDNVSIPGDGIVVNVLHIGDFRNPDGVGWSTTYDIMVDAVYWSGPGTPLLDLPQGVSGGTPNIPNLPTLQSARLMSRRDVRVR